MDDKDRVLTLASAARKAGIDPDDLRAMIVNGKLDAVETEGGNLLISENSLKLVIEESQIIESDHENQDPINEDIKQLLSQAAFFIERQESELKTYKEREGKHIALLEGAEIHINKALDQLNNLHKQSSLLSNENRSLLKTLLKLKVTKK